MGDFLVENTDLNDEVEFLDEFAGQGGFPGFAGLEFAAGEFPQAGEGFAWGPAGDEESTVGEDEGGGDVDHWKGKAGAGWPRGWLLVEGRGGGEVDGARGDIDGIGEGGWGVEFGVGSEESGASDEGIIGEGTILAADEFVVEGDGFLGLLEGFVEASLGEASLAGVNGAIGMGDDGLVGIEGVCAALFGVGAGGDAIEGDDAEDAAGRGEAIELGAGFGVIAGDEQFATGDEGGLIGGGST